MPYTFYCFPIGPIVCQFIFAFSLDCFLFVFYLFLSSLGEHPRHLLQIWRNSLRMKNPIHWQWIPSGRSVTESLYLISPNSCFCIHSAGVSPNSALNCLLNAEMESPQIRSQLFHRSASFVIIQNFIFEILRLPDNRVEEICHFRLGIVKTDIPKQFFELYFMKMDTICPVFQVTDQKFKEFR